MAEVLATELKRSPNIVGVQFKLLQENRTKYEGGRESLPWLAGKYSSHNRKRSRWTASMLLQKSTNANALRTLLESEIERSPDFLRLSNALSALYPAGSEEKRLLDAMLLAVPK